MTTSFSSLADKFTEGLHKGKCKYRKYRLEYGNVEDGSLEFKCVYCNKNCEKQIGKKGFAKANRYCNKAFIHVVQ